MIVLYYARAAAASHFHSSKVEGLADSVSAQNPPDVKLEVGRFLR